MFRWCNWCSACIIAIIFFLSPLHAQEASPRSKLVLKDSSYNFGSIVEGAAVSYDFSINNSGSSDLIIDRVIAGCGCTATSLTATNIKPGEEGRIRVSMDSHGMSGRVSKDVRIYSNDPDNAISVVSLVGDIEPEIRVEPANLFFDKLIKVSGASAPTKEVSVKVNSNSKLKIQSIKSYSKFIKVEERSVSDNEKKVEVSLDPSLPLGEFRDRVVVELIGGDRKSLNIPVFASVKGPLQVDPSAISFGIIMGDKALTKRVKLEGFEKDHFSITDITASNPLLTTKFEAIKDGKSYWISVTLDPSKISQDLKEFITIKGDGVLSESLSINVYGVLPPKL